LLVGGRGFPCRERLLERGLAGRAVAGQRRFLAREPAQLLGQLRRLQRDARF